RPYPQFTSVSEGSPSGYSTYHALQVTAQKHAGHGLSFLAAYTASKLLGSDFGNANGPPVQHPELRRTGKTLPSGGSSVTDQPQALKVSYIYELPFGNGKRFAKTSSGVLERLVGGWQVGASQEYFSGNPLVIGGNASTAIIGSQWVVRNKGV